MCISLKFEIEVSAGRFCPLNNGNGSCRRLKKEGRDTEMSSAYDKISPEEFGEMVDRNENFNGKSADFSKLALYQEIKSELVDFLQDCDDVVKLSECKPNQYEQNAVIFLDIKTISTFNKEETAKLIAIMGKADRIMVSGGDCGIRISFGVEGIWVE